MNRTPFDLSFDDLIAAGVDATAAAINEAKLAGVPVARAQPVQTAPDAAWPSPEKLIERRRRPSA